MKPRCDDVRIRIGPKWPPEQGQKIACQTKEGVKEGIVKEVRLGLVWRDFLLEDGRMIAGHKCKAYKLASSSPGDKRRMD